MMTYYDDESPTFRFSAEHMRILRAMTEGDQLESACSLLRKAIDELDLSVCIFIDEWVEEQIREQALGKVSLDECEHIACEASLSAYDVAEYLSELSVDLDDDVYELLRDE